MAQTHRQKSPIALHFEDGGKSTDNTSHHIVRPTEWTFEALKLPWPTMLLIYGSSQSGKSTLICKMLKLHKSLWINPIDNVMYINPSLSHDWANKPSKTINCLKSVFPNLCLRGDVPDFHDAGWHSWLDEQKKMYRGKDETHLLVVIDDFQQHLNSISSSIEALFTQICHHTRTSVIVTLQNPTQPGSKALTAINSMKCNLTHAIVMPSLACGATYALLEMRHNPFRSYAAGSCKNGSRTILSLEEVEKFTQFPYLLYDFNTWNKAFSNQYPVRSMICGELGEHVGALLFKADNLLCKMGHPLSLP